MSEERVENNELTWSEEDLLELWPRRKWMFPDYEIFRKSYLEKAEAYNEARRNNKSAAIRIEHCKMLCVFG